MLGADEKPDVGYSDIGGMDMQKQEMREAVELPLSHFDLYKQIGQWHICICVQLYSQVSTLRAVSLCTGHLAVGRPCSPRRWLTIRRLASSGNCSCYSCFIYSYSYFYYYSYFYSYLYYSYF